MRKTDTSNIVYSASFTTSTGGLYLREVKALYPLLVASDSREQLAREVINNEYLQVNSQRTRDRIVKQIQERMKFSFEGLLDDFKSIDDNEKALKLFYLVLKAFPLAYDFHFNVMLPTWKGSSREFDAFTYQMRIDELGNDHINVRNWSDKTRRESIAVYKRMLNDAGFINNNNYIQPRLSENFFECYVKNNEAWFLEACLLNQTERERILNLINRD